MVGYYQYLQMLYVFIYFLILCRISLAGSNLRAEQKYILFLSRLLLLFKFCFKRKHENPEVNCKANGSNISITSQCPSCNEETQWHSQLYVPGSQIRAGNFLLSFVIPSSGGFPEKIFKMHNTMGLGCVTLLHISKGNYFLMIQSQSPFMCSITRVYYCIP